MKANITETNRSELKSRSEQLSLGGEKQLSFPFISAGAAVIPQPSASRRFKFPNSAYEYRVTALRECPLPERLQRADSPATALNYWRLHVQTASYFNPDCECLVALLLNTRRKVKGHSLVSIGTMDTILFHPREVFRVAIATASASVILMHNHPSGDPSPSEADIRATRDLIRAGQLLRIEIIDHVIVGTPSHASFRELGYFTVP